MIDAVGWPCHVPSALPTIAAALADETCPVIWVAPGSYPEQLSVTREVTIRGDGGRPRINGQGTGRPITATAPLVLEGVDIVHGVADRGGCISTTTSLSLHDVVVEGCRAATAGGGIYQVGNAPLTITDSTITRNRALSTGGGIAVEIVIPTDAMEASPTITIDNSSIDHNRVTSGWGGGLHVRSGGVWFTSATTISLRRTILDANVVEVGGGGGGAQFDGAAQNHLTIAISQSTITNNRVGGTNSSAGGGIAITEPSIDDWRLVADIVESEISGNSVIAGSASGGGIAVLLGSYVDLDDTFGTITLSRTTIARNTAEGMTASGGGMLSDCHRCATSVRVVNSTISENVARAAGPARFGGAGWTDTMGGSVVNSTISGNEAVSTMNAARGGGIGYATRRGGGISILASTLSGNRATGPDAGGGGVFYEGSEDFEGLFPGPDGGLLFDDSIVAGNVATSGADCLATITPPFAYEATSEYSIFGTTPSTCGVTPTATDRVGDPSLLPLAANGGFTQTHGLSSTSSAIDAGPPTNCIAADQRGMPRVGRCDIGAFERQ